MDKRSYYEKLKDPRWQKLRLMVFERAGFMCEVCLSKDKTLTVHHGYYDKYLEPWQHNIETLHCLCLECHKEIQLTMREIYYHLAHINCSNLNDVSNEVFRIYREYDDNKKKALDLISNS